MVATPLTYMNRSGEVLPFLLRATGIGADRLLVVCDNMDLQPGVVRLKRRGASRSHNGIASIMDALGTGEFARLYLGVGRPERPDGVVEHVLSAPPADELPLYERALEDAANAAIAVEERDFDAVMNELNRRR